MFRCNLRLLKLMGQKKEDHCTCSMSIFQLMTRLWYSMLGLIGFAVLTAAFLVLCCILLLSKWNTDDLVPSHFRFSGTWKKFRVPGSCQGLPVIRQIFSWHCGNELAVLADTLFYSSRQRGWPRRSSSRSQKVVWRQVGRRSLLSQVLMKGMSSNVVFFFCDINPFWIQRLKRSGSDWKCSTTMSK